MARLTSSEYKKEIVYDRKTRDYAMYLDGELVGFGRTYHEAEVKLNELVFELLNTPATLPAVVEEAPAAPRCVTCGDDGDCPDCGRCGTCKGEGRIPAYGCGDQAGGYAETCPDCNGKGTFISAPLDLDFAPIGPEVA